MTLGTDSSLGPRGAVAAPQRRFLIVLEDAAHAGAAVTEGVELARVEGAELVFLQLPPDPSVPIADLEGGMPVPGMYVAPMAQQRADRRAAAALRAAGKCGLSAQVVRDDEDGGPAKIAALAVKERCHLIVIASAGDNAVLRLVNGSPIPGLITTSPVPVLVCRSDARQKSGRIKRVRARSVASDDRA